MAAVTLTGETHTGTLGKLGPTFCFIECEQVKQVYGKDVFCPVSVLSGFNGGEIVEFELMINQKGQPQASNVRGHQLHDAGNDAGAQGKLHGIVANVGDKFGFIQSPQVTQLYGKDAFVPSEVIQRSGIRAGDSVSFELMLNQKGQPQAHSVQHAQHQQHQHQQRGGCKGGGCKGGGKNGLSHGGKPSSYGHQGKPQGPPVSNWNSSSEPPVLLGTISQLGDKFGFIECPQVKQEYGCDVYVPIQAIPGLSPGVSVEFDLVVNQRGQPQAHNVRPPSQRGQVPVAAQSAGGSHSGVVSVIGAKFGFIHCPELKQQFGKDVFVPAEILAPYSEGQEVDFELMVNQRGQPQAHNLRPRDVSTGPPGMLQGRIGVKGPKFGFIECPEVKNQYGKDAFVPLSGIADLNAGDAVVFELMVNQRGQPQAHNVQPYGFSAGDTFAHTVQPHGGHKGQVASADGVLVGVVTKKGDKFGFISSPQVQAQYGSDAFVPAVALQNFNEGDQVEFNLMVNQKGQPQAHDLRPHGAGSRKRKFGS